MTLSDMARVCVEAQRKRGPEATVTLKLAGWSRDRARRLWPSGPLADILCESTADGQRYAVVQVRSAVVLGALAKALREDDARV